MALQFQPPPDWLAQQYINRPNPVVEGLQSANQIFQAYAQQKAAKQRLALDQQSKDVEMAKGIAANGQDFTDAYRQIAQTRDPSKAPVDPSAGQPFAPQTPSLIQRAMAHFNMTPVGQTPPAQDDMGSQFQPPTPSSGTVSGMPPTAATPAAPPSPAPADQGMPDFPRDPRLPPPSPGPSGVPLSKDFVTPTGQLDQATMEDYKKQHGAAGLGMLDKQLSISNTLQSANEKRAIQAEKDMEANRGTFEYAKAYAKMSGLPGAADQFVDMAEKQGRNHLSTVEMKDLKEAIAANASQKRGDFYEGSLDVKRQQTKLAMTKFAMEQTGGKSLEQASKVATDRLGQLKRAGGVLDQIASQGDLATRRQAAESAISTVKALVGAGVATDGQVNEFIPHNLRTKYRDWTEFLQSDATLSDFASFRKEYQNLVNREIGINQDIINASQDFGSSATDLLGEYYPNAANHITKKSKTNKLISAPQPPPHGQTVTQNGHTYTWNGTSYE